MEYFAGLDVSIEETAICVVGDDGKVVLETEVPTEPELIAEALGVLTRAGLQATSDVWGNVDFVEEEGPVEARELTQQLGARLDSEGLVTDLATEQHARLFYNHWQLPMYNLKFDLIDVSLERLEAQREAAFWNEVGEY